MVPRTRLRFGLVMLALVAVFMVPGAALAGGVAVTLDKAPTDIEAGTAFTIGFTIRSAHTDRTPQPGLSPFIVANSLTTDEQVTATGKSEGEVGHYVATLTFPSAGEWKWHIQPFGKEDPQYVLALPGPLEVRKAGAQSASAGSAAKKTVAVQSQDNAFAPKELEIAAGTTVTWHMDGKLPHTIKAVEDTFASGNVEPGGTYSFTFSKPGTYAYYCEYHGSRNGEGMFGTIKVVAAPVPAADASSANITTTQPPAAMPTTGAADMPGMLALIAALLTATVGLVLRWRSSRSIR